MFILNKIPVLYFTGLPCSGKSTIANELEKFFIENNIKCQILDGDIIRTGLNKDLGFSEEDRIENVRRICEVSKLIISNKIIPIISTISPLNSIRLEARRSIGENFIEIFTNASLEECKKRDIKGFYKRALNGEIKNFTGVDSIYEMPNNSDIVLKTDKLSIKDTTDKVVKFLKDNGFIDNNWNFINHGNNYIQSSKNKYAVFIGRFQPYHYGHIRMIEQKIKKGVPILIMVRETSIDSNNPYTTKQIINMINIYHKSNGDDVKVISIPDIESINYGRDVGYEVNEFIPEENISNISASFIRDSIKKGDTKWQDYIPEIIQKHVVEGLK